MRRCGITRRVFHERLPCFVIFLLQIIRPGNAPVCFLAQSRIREAISQRPVIASRALPIALTNKVIARRVKRPSVRRRVGVQGAELFQNQVHRYFVFVLDISFHQRFQAVRIRARIVGETRLELVKGFRIFSQMEKASRPPHFPARSKGTGRILPQERTELFQRLRHPRAVEKRSDANRFQFFAHRRKSLRPQLGAQCVQCLTRHASLRRGWKIEINILETSGGRV